MMAQDRLLLGEVKIEMRAYPVVVRDSGGLQDLEVVVADRELRIPTI
jgi:hypothetical protein